MKTLRTFLVLTALVVSALSLYAYESARTVTGEVSDVNVDAKKFKLKAGSSVHSVSWTGSTKMDGPPENGKTVTVSYMYDWGQQHSGRSRGKSGPPPHPSHLKAESIK